MAYQAHGLVRDYNAGSDTASVELIGLGVIDVWLDGVKINQGVNRGYLTHGAEVVMSVPDPHRLCEAQIVGIAASLASAGIATPSAVQRQQSGRVRIVTDASGNGSVTVTFPIAYSAAPTLYAGADDYPAGVRLSVGLPSATQFTLTVSAGPVNSNVYASWYAYGNQ